MIASNNQTQSANSKVDSWSEPTEVWLSHLLSRTYNQTLSEVKKELEASKTLAHCLLSKYVIPDLSSIDHSKVATEIIKSVQSDPGSNTKSQAQCLRIDDSNNLISLTKGNKQGPLVDNRLLPSSEKTPKNTNSSSSKGNANPQTNHKPKMIYQSLSTIISDKENSSSKINENNQLQILKREELSSTKQNSFQSQKIQDVSKRS